MMSVLKFHPGMRWLCLCLILASCNSGDKKILKQPAPPLPSKSQEVLQDNVDAIQIRLNNSASVMVDGIIVDSLDLKNSLREAKRNKGDTATVVLHLKGDTEFGMFTAVHRSLEELLLEERDSVAQLRFNTNYGNLSETQQVIIKRKHHLRIIEKMRR